MNQDNKSDFNMDDMISKSIDTMNLDLKDLDTDFSGSNSNNTTTEDEGDFSVELLEGAQKLVFKVRVNKSKEKTPKELIDLYVELESTNNILKELKSTNEDKENQYIKQLEGIAKVGLTGPYPKPDLAKASLAQLKEEVLIERGGIIKNRYMGLLGISALILMGVGLILWFFLHIDTIYFNVWCGSMIGAWLSYGARKTVLDFNDLARMEADRISPLLRLIFIGLTTFIVLLMFNNGFITVTVGSVTTGEAANNLLSIKNNMELQILFGALCGIIETPLAGMVAKKATDVIKI